jgi:N-acetylglucosamine-6-phosphate deacetylase
VHFEGPIISSARAGAHAPEFIDVPTVEAGSWTRGHGVAMVTLAPEVDGAIDVIDVLTAHGVVVAIGHTDCTAAQFATARSHGASMVTHLFNAMAPFSHRAPGPIGAVLADDAVLAGLICDGIHVDPVAVAMAWRSLGPRRTVLVTDAVAALGVDASTARLGDLDVTIGPDGVRTAAGVLAGSNLSLDQAVRNLIEFTGCDVTDAIATVTTSPAGLLSLTDRGAIEPGRRADIVVLDTDLCVTRTIIEGHTAWKS